MKATNLLIVIASVMLFGCSNPETDEQSIKIDSFSKFPNEVDGAGCYFSATKKDKENGNCVFCENFENVAFMKLNGKFVRFTLKDRIKISQSREKTIYESANYELILFSHRVDQVDYSSYWQGTIRITAKDGKDTGIKFYGDCGC